MGNLYLAGRVTKAIKSHSRLAPAWAPEKCGHQGAQ